MQKEYRINEENMNCYTFFGISKAIDASTLKNLKNHLQ